MFDLTIYPLFLDAGREQHDLPGLMVLAAPRKAARMRAQDHLLLYMKLMPLTGTTGLDLSPSQQQEMLHRLADTYFTTAGSVTAGLREVAVRLNEFLLNRNLKAGQTGQTLGILNLVAVHGGSAMVAHAGATHTFVLSKTQVQHFDDSAAARVASARGLGLGRQPVLRFYQTPIESGDLLITCVEPPATWNTRSLANSPQLSIDYLRRRLLSDSSGDLQAAVVRFQAGKGTIQTWHPADGEAPRPASGRAGARQAASAAAQQPRPASPVQRETPAVKAPEPVDQPALQRIEIPAEGLPAVGDDGAVVFATPAPPQQDLPGVYLGSPLPPRDPTSTAPVLTPRPPLESEPADHKIEAADHTIDPAVHKIEPGVMKTAPAVEQPLVAEGIPTRQQTAGRLHRQASTPARPARVTPEKPAGPPVSEEIRRRLAGVWQKGSAARARTGEAFGKVAVKLPKRHDAEGNEQPFFNIPSSIMLAAAIIVPILVATMALVVFDRIGRADRLRTLLEQAQQYADQAAAQTDPALQRDSWAKVYEHVSALERSYGKNEQSTALRNQAVTVLDGLEGYVRLSYTPVMTNGLPQGTEVTRMVATFSDVYLLDSGLNRILRLYRTGNGYELDSSFTCGEVKAGAADLGKIIDIAPLPPNNARHATILGVEAGGNLIYCAPGTSVIESQPLALPDNGWGEISGIYFYNDTLFVLDAKANAVYYYIGEDGGFPERPHFYFGSNVPPISDVIDMAVDQEFLYLLHGDGRMTLCESAGYALATANCTDPIPYGDSRPGFDSAPLTFMGSRFTQIITTQPPDPSLYALDAANKSIYHLSLRRLNLQRQYRPLLETDFPLPRSEPTAFTVAPNRWVLMAFENQVFFAPIP